jgi:mono/diheme cytochrome c family protein
MPDIGDWTLTLVVERDAATADIGFVVPVNRQAPAEPVPAPDTGAVVPAPLAAMWSLLPSGVLGWLPAVGGLLALPMTWRLRPSGMRSAVRIGVVTLVVVGGIGAATRSAVDAANAPDAALLETPPAALDAGVGESIFLANCASCHGRGGGGDGPIDALPEPAPLADVVRRTTAAELSYRIAYGVAGTSMPAFAGTLTRDERWALVAYLRERWATEP